MDLQLSQRVQSIKPSPTLAVSARAAALRAEGRNVIGLGAGEPNFETPEHVKEAAIRAIHEGFTHYTAVDGIASLKSAIIAKFKRDNGLDYEPAQILVSCGAKQSFFNLAQALLNAGDEVVIPAPYWVSYPDMVLLAGATPVVVESGLEDGFKITPEALDAHMSPRTRLVVLNSPSNPTGVSYSKDELAALGEVLLRHPQTVVVSDDIYEHVRLENAPFHNILSACPELYGRTVVLNGVSKAYAMTGWRIGYAGGPARLIKAMKNIQSQSTSNPTSIAQVAAQAALDGDQACIGVMGKAFRERHEYVFARLGAIPGVRCLRAQGAFYAFPSVQGLIDQLPEVADDVALSEHLLNAANVAVVPGAAFGAAGYVRLSFATSMDNLREALDRIETVARDAFA